MQPIFAILRLTVQAAIRNRLVIILGFLLLCGVVALPVFIKHDGTARGLTQILLAYTLSMTTAMLGFASMWLGCGTLAREIQEAQMQMVVVKPVARWKIWVGKFLGIMTLNAFLLLVAGTAIFFLLQWKARSLSPKEMAALRNEVMVSRASAAEPVPDYQGQANKIIMDRLKGEVPPDVNVAELKTYITEQVKASLEIVAPGLGRQWTIDLGTASGVKDLPLYVRAKFNAAKASESGSFETFWELGVPESARLYRTNILMAPDATSEFQVPANLVGDDGVLTVRFYNYGDTPLIFPLEDGMEVLYREGGFALNFYRGLGVVLCWLAVLTALGLTASSLLSFPVATFCTLGMLIVGMSTGTLKQVMGVNHETGFVETPTFLDSFAVAASKGTLRVLNLARGFSPIDNLSSGRSVGWLELARAFFQMVVVICGAFGALGIYIFSRRELASAQNQI
jgi:ABC-type transport system involved in multi-copper enzyme maturation permease subunit